jgi:hypothetical protein
MRSIPSYLVMALLGLAFISAGLITMFADTSEVAPTEDAAALVPTATLTLTPLPPTPTVYIPPPTIAPPPTVVIPTAIPTVIEVLPSPTEVVVDVPTAVPTDVPVAAPVDTVAETPLTSESTLPTAETVVVEGVAQEAPTIDPTITAVESPTLEFTPTETPTIDPAAGSPTGEAGAVGASEGDSSTSPNTDANNAPPAPTVETVPADGVQPTAQSGEGAVPVVPTTDPALVPPVVPTTDPALVPPVVPTTDPAVVVPDVPTSDPALLPTAAEDTTSVGAPEEAASPAPAQVFGVVTFADVQDHTGIVVTLTLPDGTTVEAATDAAGLFNFQNLPPGNYRVIASAAGYLSRQADFGVGEGQVVTLPPTSLPVGDTNLDNMIDLTDAALIASNFDSPATVPEADINRDGWIDVKDLALVGADYGQTGPLPWQ